jgi:predicted methyltransferase
MPKVEVVPVISDMCVEGGVVNPDRWSTILDVCRGLGAKRAIYWRDCASGTSPAEVKVASDSIRAAGVSMGIKVV